MAQASPIETDTGSGGLTSSAKVSCTSVRIASATVSAARAVLADDDGELVAAEAPDDAVAADDAGHLAQHDVAGVVAELVVDLLEVVDVDDAHDGVRDGEQLACLDGPVAAVEHAGELVELGLALELGDPRAEVAFAGGRLRDRKRRGGRVLELAVVESERVERGVEQ